jgi:hypothetical protein
VAIGDFVGTTDELGGAGALVLVELFVDAARCDDAGCVDDRAAAIATPAAARIKATAVARRRRTRCDGRSGLGCIG